MNHPVHLRRDVTLPATFWEALLRGMKCRCPRCGEGSIFRKWLKPRDNCPTCGLDMSGQRSDDFPAYIAIFATGHLLAPLIIMLVADYALGPAALLAIIVPVAVAMMLALLQPSKGAVIALQWWNGMHGFRRERAITEDEEADR